MTEGRQVSVLRPRRALQPAPAGTAHELFDEVAAAAARLVLKRYSTSFGLASRLLAEPVRTRVRNIYAMVRVADEVVDAPHPGTSVAQQVAVLDELEQQLHAALMRGHSPNLIAHAFAGTARQCGIGRDLVDPFLASMRTDLFGFHHDSVSLDRYVHGSAEVVGLMCLRAFVADEPDPEGSYSLLAPEAQRLGAAFQKVNFLRDLASDEDTLGRHYLPGVDLKSFDEATRDRLLDDIDTDLAVAAVAIPRLPHSSRRAVRVAHRLYAGLAAQLRRTPAARIRTTRVRVSAPTKARIVAGCLVGGAR